MSKRRIGKLYNKIVVEGDHNLLNNNEVLLTQTNNIGGGMQLELKDNNTVSLSSSKYYLCKGDPVSLYYKGEDLDFASIINPHVIESIKCYLYYPEYPDLNESYTDLSNSISDPELCSIVGFNIDYDKIIDIDRDSIPHKCITISDAIKSNPESYKKFKRFINNFTEVSREQYMDVLSTEKWKYK